MSGRAQCLPNIGFEDGTFKNWQCYVGDVDTNGVIEVYPSIAVPNVHTIIDKNTFPKKDPWGDFPTLCPNGSKYSIRLGNDDVSARAERVAYNFTIPSTGRYTLVLNYAVVLQNPGHLSYQQPRFTVKVFDVTDHRYIDCPAFDFIASSLPGFKVSDHSTNNASVSYKEWSSTTINLLGYAGKEIRIEFTTNDCTRGGHFGYAYLDINEQCTPPITGNVYCNGQTEVTLHAPNGFYKYLWYKEENLNQPIDTGEILKLSPAPPDNTKYALIIVPYPGLGCLDTLHTTISKLNNAFNFHVKPVLYGCPGTGVDLTATSVTDGSDADIALSYHTDPKTLDYVYSPDNILKSGTYYIQAVSPQGCTDILPVNVVITNPDVMVTDPPEVQYPNGVDLSTTHDKLQKLTYTYYTNPEATIPVSDYKNVNVSGTYYIKAVSDIGCISIKPVNVTIGPPPPYIIKGAKVFTPNNDGINDHFMIDIDGFVTFASLKIYDRYGQLLFTTTSQQSYWDGTYNGRQLPAGTYYWLFEGTDMYYRTVVNKASSVTIVR